MKIIKGWNPLTIFEKSSILGVRLCSQCLSLFLKEVWVDEEPISLIRMKTQQKIKSLLNDADVVNVEQWIKNVECLCCHDVDLWNTLNYWILDTWYECTRSDCSPATLLNLNTCIMFKIRYSVPEPDLGLPELLRWTSMWH